MTDRDPQDPTVRLNTILYITVVVSVCLAVVVGLFVFRPAWQDHRAASERQLSERTAEDVAPEVYTDVLRAATEVTDAFFNVDHEDLDESLERVAAGATGPFAEQVEGSLDELRRTMTENETIIESTVLASGVVAISDFTARVLVGVSGVVQNTSTQGAQQAREFRIQLDLNKVQDQWLVNDLQFVG